MLVRPLSRQRLAFRKLPQRLVSTLPPLPPLEEWKHLFPMSLGGRISVKNENTAELLASSFLPAASKNKVVIEAFPGPGVLTRSLLALPRGRLRKLIVLEDVPEYLKYLQVLEAHDSRVKVIPLSGFNWSTYNELEANSLLADVSQIPWEDGVHPNLHFISHIPQAIVGDQIVAQFFRCIPERSWLFKYGRVPMSLILNEQLWQRVSAPLGHRARCKVTIIAEATSKHRPSVAPELLTPYNEHFHPLPYHAPQGGARRTGQPFVSVNIIPKDKQEIDKNALDKWDFILRRLFVLKSTPLKRAISSLAPGSVNLLKPITDLKLPPGDRVDVTKSPRDLRLKDWAAIVKAFDEWPFAPEDLAITDTFFRNVERD